MCPVSPFGNEVYLRLSCKSMEIVLAVNPACLTVRRRTRQILVYAEHTEQSTEEARQVQVGIIDHLTFSSLQSAKPLHRYTFYLPSPSKNKTLSRDIQ